MATSDLLSDDLPTQYTGGCYCINSSTQLSVECVAMATNDTPVLDELCLSLFFDLLHSLDGAHCKGSREGELR